MGRAHRSTSTVSAPTPEALTETVAHAITIAPQLKSDAAWLWIDAYWPPRNDRDRPTRPRPRGVGEDPDHVPGERLALGIGNDTARAAYTRSAQHVTLAHRLAGLAVATHNNRTPPPARQHPARGHEHALYVDSTIRRLRWLLEHDAAHATDQTRRHTHAAAIALIEAHAALLAVMRDIDGTGEPDANRRCDNCGDPCPPGWTRRECDKCRRYRQRTGRPRMIRRHEDARRARDRRRARGEDAGASPLPRPSQEAS